MKKKGFLRNVRIAVLLGYILLFFLSVIGGYLFYKELINFSQHNKPFSERKQLTLISNALVTMYKAESIKKVMLSENVDLKDIDSSYSAINKNTKLYIDSLYTLSNDEKQRLSLDTVKNLLTEKDKNLYNIRELLVAIKKLPYSNQILTTVLSKKDVDNLFDIFDKNIQKQVVDSSFFIKKKKGLFSRIKSVFTEDQDSTKVLAKQTTETKDTTFVKPAKLLTDTIVQFINDVSLKSDKKKARYIAQLSQSYREMLSYDELLTGQIHSILYNLEAKERSYVANATIEKDKAVKKSSNIMSIIAWASLLTVLFFIFLTLRLIDKSESFKNKLEQSKKKAEDLMKSRERLLLMISHDIKAPLSSIIGHIELISKDKMSQNEKGHIDNMKYSSEHILELVNKLMDYHKLEQGKSEVNNITFSPSQLMEDIFQSFVPVINDRLSYKLHNKISKNDMFECDPFVVKQIINNLISNAVKFTKQGKIDVSSSVDNEGTLKVSVKDTGMGIKSEDIQKIFDEFQRVGETKDKNRVEGFGLGLAITHKLVKLLNGDIQVESVYGKGSEFKVFIPLKQCVEIKQKIAIDNSDVETVRHSIKNAKLLFVDDDLVMLNVYEKLLQREGADVIVCSSSNEALSILNNSNFDVILSDIQMPEMNGFEFVKKIRGLQSPHYKKVKVVALSARTDISEKDFKEAGFNAFITKPVKFTVLLAKINELLNDKSVVEIKTEPDENPKGIHSLIEFVEDDAEASKDILVTFESENKVKLDELTSSSKSNNWAQIKATSHKLLPLMKMIDEKDMVEMLVRLEKGEKKSEDVNNVIERLKKVNEDVANFITTNYPR